MIVKLFELKNLDKTTYLFIIYLISALVTIFWSLCFWFTFDSSITTMVSNDMVTPWLLVTYLVVFVIYAFFYYSIMKPHYEWVARMVRSAND